VQPDESYAKAGSLWQNRDYLYLTTGETVSTLGGGVASFALPLVILTLTGSALSAGVVAMASMVGNLSASVVVGGWVDAHSRRAAMASALAVRTISWFGLVALVVSSSVNVPIFACVGFIGGAAAALYRAAEAGALKVLISKDQFPSAISVIEGRHAAADLAGGPLGAFLLGISASLPFLFS